MTKYALPLSFLSILLLAACGDDDRPRITMDAGGTPDSGDMADSGGDMDSGADIDSGPDMDAGTDAATDMDAATDAGPTASDMIAALRAMADGTGLSVSLSGVFVTYLKPAVGGESAGFFVQAEMAGPAIFVAVDPTTTTPTVEVGDELSFTVTDLGTTGMLREVTAITDLMELSTGTDVSGLIQDVSAATDLVSALDTYESERVSASFTVAAAFSGAGAGFEAAAIDTAGITGDANLRFRLPATLRASMDLVMGCTLTVDGVMWRFNDAAQISIFEQAFATAVTCPAPTVVGAVASSATEVVVTFDRTIDPASVTAPDTQFVIVDDTATALPVSAASVTGSIVTLTTNAQTAGTTYTLTVAATVTDTLGTGVDATANTATFTGFTPPVPTVMINEVDYDNVSTDSAEFVELYNPGTAAFDLTGIQLVLVNGSGPTVDRSIALPASIAAGGYIVVANPGTVTVPTGVTEVDLGGSIQNGPDGVAVVNTTTSTLIDALSYEDSITGVDISGTMYDLVEGTATSAADSNSVNGSLSRIPNGSDTNDAATDWQFVTTPTPGAANTP